MELEPLFSQDSQLYDTRKVLNRAGSARIEPQFFTRLAEEGLTSEYLVAYKLPVYKYTTQITLHGVFESADLVKVGGYKNVIINQNKTIGIRYNAIDYAKKKRLGDYLELYGWRYSRDSNGDAYRKSYRGLEPLKSEYNRININGFYASKGAAYSQLLGIYYLTVAVKALFENEFWRLFEAISGHTQAEAEARMVEAKAEEAAKQAAYAGKLAEYKAAGDEKRAMARAQLNDVYKPQLAGLPDWSGNYQDGLVLVRAVIGDYNEPGFRMYRLQKAGGWYKPKTLFTAKLSSRPGTEKSKLSYRTEAELIKGLRGKENTVWKVLEGVEKTASNPAASAAAGAGWDWATITHNTRKGGIEVKFPGKPPQAVIDRLKGNGFKWSSAQGLWYAEYRATRWEWVQDAQAQARAAAMPVAPVRPTAFDLQLQLEMEMLDLLQL